MRTELYIGKKRYNIYLGTKRYFFYIANKVIETILEFLSLPAKFISNKAQELVDYKIYGNSIIEDDNLFDYKNAEITNLYQASTTAAGVEKTLARASTLSGFIFDVSTITGNITVSRKINGTAFRIFGTTDYPNAGVMSTSLAIMNSSLKLTCDVTNYNYIVVIVTNITNVPLEDVIKDVRVDIGSDVGIIKVNSVGDRSKNLYEFPYKYGYSLQGSGNNRTVYRVSKIQACIVELKPNTTYTLSGDRSMASDTFARLGLFTQYPEVGAVTTRFISYNSANIKQTTFTTSSTETYAMVFSNSGQDEDCKMMLTEGTSTEYEPYSYKIPMLVLGNNLFNPENIITGYLGANGYVASASFRTFFFPVKGGQSYTISKTFASYRFIVKGFKSIPTTSTPEDQTISVSTNMLCRFTANEDIKYVLIFGWHTSDTATVDEIANSIMVNTGSTALPYEPYVGKEIDIFIEEPLHKVDDYVDYLDYKNQKLIRNVDSETMTGLTVPIEEDIELVPSNIPEGTLTIDIDTSVMPSKVIIEGDIANE